MLFVKMYKEQAKVANHLVSFSFQKVSLLNIILCMIYKAKPRNSKGRSRRTGPMRACQWHFLYLKSKALMAPSKVNLPYLHLPLWWGWVSA
jgi:hypothetical protein